MSNIIIFDMKTVTGVQLLTEDFLNINLEPKDITYLEIHDPVICLENSDNDYDVSYAKIIIKNADKVLKIPLGWGAEDSSSEAAKEAYTILLKKNLSGISVEQNNEWKSYYFTPKDWNGENIDWESLSFEEIQKISDNIVNSRIEISNEGEFTTIIAIDENAS